MNVTSYGPLTHGNEANQYIMCRFSDFHIQLCRRNAFFGVCAEILVFGEISIKTDNLDRISHLPDHVLGGLPVDLLLQLVHHPGPDHQPL